MFKITLATVWSFCLVCKTFCGEFMRIALVTMCFLMLLPNVLFAGIYKWVDENGRVHFSDKPMSHNAKSINVKPNKIKEDKKEDELSEEDRPKWDDDIPDYDKPGYVWELPKSNKTSGSTTKSMPITNKVVTAADYKINVSVGKLGHDVIRVSGRVGDGPACKKMLITAHARNRNGLSTIVQTETKLSNPRGSAIFEGTNTVTGSSKDKSFWKVVDVIVSCKQ